MIQSKKTLHLLSWDSGKVWWEKRPAALSAGSGGPQKPCRLIFLILPEAWGGWRGWGRCSVTASGWAREGSVSMLPDTLPPHPKTLMHLQGPGKRYHHTPVPWRDTKVLYKRLANWVPQCVYSIIHLTKWNLLQVCKAISIFKNIQYSKIKNTIQTNKN